MNPSASSPLRSSVFAVLLALGSAASAQQPAPAQQPAAARLPETVTTGLGAFLTEEAAVGVTERPEWTSARRFTGTRIYLQKEPWEAGVESWWRFKNHRDNSFSHRLLEEVEIGLPGRFQLDLYNDIEGDERGKFHYQSFNVELRWALANWGKIWGNPTLYAEYKFADHHWGPDVYELKLLLGDQIMPRLHWGVNFVWEAEIGGEREQEFQVTAGLSYTLIDQKLGIGLEGYYDRDTVRNFRGNPDDTFFVGPSLQYRLTKNWHVDVSCQFGLNNVSDRQVGFVIVGYDFGAGGHSEHGYSPISGRRN